jgi:hypothetical protein
MSGLILCSFSRMSLKKHGTSNSGVDQMSEVPKDIASLLGPGEHLELYLKQKIYHPKINIDSIALTNERIILRHPRDLALKKDFTDFSYKDIANAVLDKGVLRSTIKCILRFGGEPLILGKIANADAEKAYGIIRSNIARYQPPLSIPGTTAAPGATSVGVKCPKCGAITTAARFCPVCGSTF